MNKPIKKTGKQELDNNEDNTLRGEPPTIFKNIKWLFEHGKKHWKIIVLAFVFTFFLFVIGLWKEEIKEVFMSFIRRESNTQVSRRDADAPLYPPSEMSIKPKQGKKLSIANDLIVKKLHEYYLADGVIKKEDYLLAKILFGTEQHALDSTDHKLAIVFREIAIGIHPPQRLRQLLNKIELPSKRNERYLDLQRRIVLEVDFNGPDEEFLGRRIDYTITITNKSGTIAENIVVQSNLLANVQDINTDGDIIDNKVVWKIQRLASKRRKTVHMSYLPNNIGQYKNELTLKADHYSGYNTSKTTDIKGMASLSLEVIDIEDPVRTGDNVTYIIAVVNQGKDSAENIIIRAELEDSMQFVSFTGPTKGKISYNTVIFNPLHSLSPRSKATWQVTVKAVKAAQARFKVAISCDQYSKELIETEATVLYE